VNFLKIGFLMALLTGLFVVAGTAIGGTSGAVIAFVIAFVMNFGAYWFSDKMALAGTHAQEVTPEQAPELHAIVDELAAQAKMPKPRVYIIDAPQPNAFATGRNKSLAVVAVTTGILRILDRRELRGVLGHELSHIGHYDMLVNSIVAVLAGAIVMIGNFAQFAAIFGGFGGRDGEGRGGNILTLLLLAIVMPIAATIVRLAISRSCEYNADSGGAKLTRDPEALASALLKLERGANAVPMPVNAALAPLFIVNPLKAVDFGGLFSTHPPIPERVERLMAMRGRV
jgi:heat shock protein HtpX